MQRELQSMDPKNMQDPWVYLRGYPGIPNLRLHHPIFIQLPLDLMVTSHLKKKKNISESSSSAGWRTPSGFPENGACSLLRNSKGCCKTAQLLGIEQAIQ